MDDRKSVLVVEDEEEIRQLLVLQLERSGFRVTEARDGGQALNLLNQNLFDLVVLDWMLPEVSGLEILRAIRQSRTVGKVPVLFVTAKTEAEDITEGLESGADDYVTKPFDMMVFLARAKALVRRHEWMNTRADSNEVALGPIKLKPESFTATLAEQPLELTRSEFKLLQSLMENQGKVLTRAQLIQEIQGDGVNVIGRTVDTHIFGLRKKLGEWGDRIETVRGVGYRVPFHD